MKSRLSAIRVVALAVVCLAGMFAGVRDRRAMRGPLAAAAEPAGKKPGATDELPPLVIHKSAPLLLEEPADKKTDKARKFLSINQTCFVCHDNFKDEPLMLVHAEEEIGCVDCHGDSVAHRNDEDNVTPPDVMYPPGEIDEACQECHDTHDAPAKKIVARWQDRCPEKTDVTKLVCTDCHGQHRLKTRTVRWDKRTRKLLVKPAKNETGNTGD